MRLVGILLLLITLFFVSPVFGQIEFREGSWEEILEMSEAEGKPVFVDAYAVWCGPCKVMDQQIFTQAEVGNFFNENFINAKIDMEKGEGPGLQRQYKVTAYPTLLFIDRHGELLHRAVGMQDAQRLINNGELALRKNNNSVEYAKKYESGERDPEFVLAYLGELKKAGKPTEKIALEYFQEESRIPGELKAKIAFEGLENVDSKLFALAMDGKKYLKEDRTEEEYNAILKKAAENTMNTAIQFDSPELFQQAVRDLLKMEADPGMLTSLERTYYGKTKNEEAFMKSVEQELGTTRPDKARIAMDIYEAFPESTGLLEYARNLFDEVYPNEISIQNLMTGLSIAIGLKDEPYMDRMFEMARSSDTLSDADKNQAMSLYMKAKRYLKMKMRQSN